MLDNQYRFYIARLSKTYSAIPVSKISQVLGSSTEQLISYLEVLIREGQLNAHLEETGRPEVGVVIRFFLDPTKGPLAKTEKQQQQALVEQTQATNTLAEHVRSAGYRLSLTKEYIEQVKRQQKKATLNPEPMPMHMDTSWEDAVMEEDVMGEAH